MTERIIGLMAAMPEEINGVVELLEHLEEFNHGMRTYYTGTLNGIKVVVVFSRWGKVAAATTVTHLITGFRITELIFTGVAGAVNHALNIGDIVVASRLIQHDMDARPLMPRFEIPLLGKTYFECAGAQLTLATEAANAVLQSKNLHAVLADEDLQAFGITAPKVMTGEVASGDKFFSGNEDKDRLLEVLPNVMCVEMEGAAVAQVCFEYRLPFTIIRTISDAADEQSHIDFPLFIQKIASRYSVEVVKQLLGC